MDKAKTGSLIKESRLKKGMTQNQLAEKLSVTNKAVSRWENGNSFPDITLLSEIAEVLDLSIEELVLGERKNPEEKQERYITSEILEDVVKEAKGQKNQKAKKLVNCLLTLAVIVCLLMFAAFLFMVGCFYFIQSEINLEEAMFTCALGAFAFALVFCKFGLPLLGIGIAGFCLNNGKFKNKFVRILMMIMIAVCVGYLIFNIIS